MAMTQNSIEPRKRKNLGVLIGFFLIMVITIGILIIILPEPTEEKSEFTNFDVHNVNDENSWVNNPYRMEYTENVNNLTLLVDFGNGTIFQRENITLMNHFTSGFDLLESNCKITFITQYFGTNVGYYVNSINGLREDLSNFKYWQFFVNGQYAQKGANLIQLQDNDIMNWNYTSSML